jgi:hypothetical protein
MRTSPFDLLVLVFSVALPQPRSALAQARLPAVFRNDRIFLQTSTATGDTVSFYTDTGGGLFVRPELLTRLGITVRADSTVALSQFRFADPIPEPLGASDGRLPVYYGSVSPATSWDGLLGQAWFADRVWVLDYRRHTLRLLPSPPSMEATHTVVLGFQTDSLGNRLTSFPRIRISIDGDSLDLLFDTGAMVLLTGAAKKALDGDADVLGTSFITTGVFQRWRERHPDWQTIASADSMAGGMAMIRVPAVDVAGYRIGPVWFTQRPDRNFHQFMSQWMDRRVDGALGGSAFRHFGEITLDYPGARVHFDR